MSLVRIDQQTMVHPDNEVFYSVKKKKLSSHPQDKEET